MSGLLQKYADLVTISDRARTNTLLAGMSAMSEGEAAAFYGGSHAVGECFIKDSPGDTPAVLEVVMAKDGVDSFATLYAPHPLFNNRDSYREGRQELVECVLDLANASVLGVQVMCPARNRRVDIRDLAFKQLLELIQGRVDSFHGK